ncbi:MAG: hypothetical protein JWM59_1526 [Verrucomicrobiales bacterium]|nr:hypothetical protein [Verrucomicrobiales bacterium]
MEAEVAGHVSPRPTARGEALLSGHGDGMEQAEALRPGGAPVKQAAALSLSKGWRAREDAKRFFPRWRVGPAFGSDEAGKPWHNNGVLLCFQISQGKRREPVHGVSSQQLVWKFTAPHFHPRRLKRQAMAHNPVPQPQAASADILLVQPDLQQRSSSEFGGLKPTLLSGR